MQGINAEPLTSLPSMKTGFSLLWWPALVFYDDQLLSSMVAGIVKRVKSGEEW